MKNSIKMLGNFLIIALVAIIGFSMAACSEDPEPDTVTIADIPGVTAPVIGATPVSQITPTAQYTGIVSWSPSGTFKPMTVYTATITLYEKEGWTCRGVPANFFTVAGATATNAADSYIITAVFPATGIATGTFSSITEMDTWLKSQSGNTEETPYLVKLNVSDLKGGYRDDGSAGKTLNANPSKYVILDLSGSTITSIGQESFSLCDNIVELIIGNTVTRIGYNAFSVNSNLKSVTIPESVTEIGEGAFYNCQALTNVIIPAAVTSIGRKAFYSCISITGITIPAAVTTIEMEVFSGCSALTAINVEAENTKYTSDDGVLYNKAKTYLIAYPAGKADDSFTIPDSVTYIYSDAFSGNRNLTSITIPASYTRTDLKGDYFSDFAKLAAINVAAANTAYSSENGVLYNKDKTRIIRYPASKVIVNDTFTIPDTVTEIGNYAFYYCGFTSVIIPVYVTSIGDYAFQCPNLVSVDFRGTIASTKFSSNSYYPAFPGDLRTKFYATDTTNGTPGTYTRPTKNSSTWTKQP